MTKEEKLMLRELYSSVNANQRVLLERFFPELKESEGERIRKELIGFIENWKNPNNLGRPQDYPMFTKNEEQCNKYITWLEKQGKKEYALNSCEHEDVRKFIQHIEKEAKAYEIELPNRSYDIYAFAKGILAWLEKQDKQTDIINNQSDCVDLGLPSGTLWCKHNLGAEKETDFGLFFQWGDTQGYSSVNVHQFSWNKYKWGTGDNLTKYNSTDEWTQLLALKSNKLVLDNEDDPVWAATDGKMKSPTKEQLQELRNHTNLEWVEIDGVKGMKFINKNDDTKYIFIPAAGDCIGSGYDGVGSWGFLWSSSRDSDDPRYAWRLYFDSGNISMYSTYRCLGYSVRGVINR